MLGILVVVVIAVITFAVIRFAPRRSMWQVMAGLALLFIFLAVGLVVLGEWLAAAINGAMASLMIVRSQQLRRKEKLGGGGP